MSRIMTGNASFSNESSDYFKTVDDLELDHYLTNGIQVVIYLAIMCGVGVLGNVHVLASYARRRSRSHHQIFIVTLATVDILACSLSLPFEIADVRLNYTFRSNIACKLFRFLNHFLTIGSGSLQVIIAFERYRKLCRPFDRQFTRQNIKVACAVGMGFALVLSIPSFIFCGVEESQLQLPDIRNISVPVHDCTSSLPKFKESYIYLVVLLAVCTLLYIACLVMYIFVGKSLYRHRLRYDSYRRESDYINSDIANTLDDTLNKKESTSFIKSLADNHDKKAILKKRPKPKRIESQKSDATDKASNFSLMMLLSTALSYLGYIPTIILGIVRSTNRSKFDEFKAVSEPLILILMRGYFLNNVINPVVYFCMDSVFRQDCKLFWRKILPCPRKENEEYS